MLVAVVKYKRTVGKTSSFGKVVDVIDIDETHEYYPYYEEIDKYGMKGTPARFGKYNGLSLYKYDKILEDDKSLSKSKVVNYEGSASQKLYVQSKSIVREKRLKKLLD